MRRFLLVPVLALALAATGCGSASKGGAGGGSIPAGASVVRAGVLAFVSIDSDTGSGQWHQLDKLAQKFPNRDKLVTQLKQQLSKNGVDYDRDVKPALGPEVDVAVISGGTEETTNAVALTKPDDVAKFKALVAKLNASESAGNRAVYRETDGWYVLSDDEDAITRALQGNGGLADDAAFKEAMDKLPGDALAKAYVDGPGLNALVSRAAGSSASGLDSSSLGLGSLKWASAALTAEDEGVRLKGTAKGGNLAGADFASALMGGVPGDAFALLDFSGKGTADQLDKLRSNPQVATALEQLKAQLGVTADELAGLLGGELAFYVRPGAVIPEFTLALKPQDESAALATLDKLAARLASASGGHVTTDTQDGRLVKAVDLGNISVRYGSAGDGKIVVTTGLNGIPDFAGSGSKLSDSADFKEAKDTAGMPDSTGGITYVDIKNLLPVLEGFANLAGGSVPQDTFDNLRPLRSLLAWSEGSGDTRSFDAFLEIK